MRVYRRKRRVRLFIRRTVICIVLAGILYIIGLGAAASIGKINSMLPKTEQTGSSGGGSPPSSASSIGQKPAESARSDGSSRQSSAESAETESKANAPAGYFQDAVLIGDSRTEGLRNYDGLDGATYYAAKGLMVNTAFTKPVIEVGGRRLTVVQALQKRKFGKVYIMFGVNELGWSSSETFIKAYAKLIDAVKKAQPKAEIFVQSIFPVSEKKSSSDKVYNNRNIASYNRQIQEMAKKKGVKYLAVNTAVSDSAGNLPADASVDGVHLNREYCAKWCGFLKASAGERN
ncbi:GDSL-type esterase/lipase family protein [Caproiciproducens galactitolivorans]|uniref:GDSL-type esterase/lipase family protein n=1 Tax=Caproiciproducens galactitolivorans TaxID=642589 RepID=A0ABT4BWL8_9FIRM|nr:GDSL-type esterase/lipase family protein [Caproiciproducens galactitolivorans]MCY1715284.1 GDSL-type esterase/lipase family protein [Caproiciproducens galactitolivorans]